MLEFGQLPQEEKNHTHNQHIASDLAKVNDCQARNYTVIVNQTRANFLHSEFLSGRQKKRNRAVSLAARASVKT